MEIIKYLCEFFFCDIWHYLGLLLLVGVVFDKYKDDIESLAACMINEHPDKKEEIEKIVKQLIRRE